MSEGLATPDRELRPASDRALPDWRRLEVAARRFAQLINGGVDAALRERRDVDRETARCIAHVLGRAFGRESRLSEFGRTGDSDYEGLRAEYLALYRAPEADPATKELVDWLGAHLVAREGIGSGRRFMSEFVPPKLDLLLVRRELIVGARGYVAHLPASWDELSSADLAARLEALGLVDDAALQAFLSLPDVDAGSDNLIESYRETYAGSFPSEEAALRALSPLDDWEAELGEWCVTHGVDYEALRWNLQPLLARLRDIYDLAERDGSLHAFAK